MEKPILAIDFDDVSIDLRKFGENYLIKKYFKEVSEEQTQKIKEEMKNKRFEEYLKITHEEMLQNSENMTMSEEFLEIELLPGFVKAIKILSKHFSLVCATSRPETHREVIKKVLDKHVPEMFDEIILMNLSPHETKISYCNERNFFALIDDWVANFNGINKTKIKGILYNQPWNKEALLEENIIRKDSWEEITEYLLKEIQAPK